MSKDFSVIALFDIYKGLLTDKQRQIFSAYYLLDLSLSEIAEDEGTTRQSVHDAIKKVLDKLNEYEHSLKLQQKFFEVKSVLAESNDKETVNRITEILNG